MRNHVEIHECESAKSNSYFNLVRYGDEAFIEYEESDGLHKPYTVSIKVSFCPFCGNKIDS